MLNNCKIVLPLMTAMLLSSWSLEACEACRVKGSSEQSKHTASSDRKVRKSWHRVSTTQQRPAEMAPVESAVQESTGWTVGEGSDAMPDAMPDEATKHHEQLQREIDERQAAMQREIEQHKETMRLEAAKRQQAAMDAEAAKRKAEAMDSAFDTSPVTPELEPEAEQSWWDWMWGN